jgi:dephospho-CoA kinase
MSICIGLTGGIGCGKSTVADLFAERGAGVIDTDVISQGLTQVGGGAIEALSAEFGADFITDAGALDRVKMRGLVFFDLSAKQRLERILHPLIFDQAKAQMQLKQTAPYLLVVVPLLPSSRTFRPLMQKVLMVDCGEQTRIERVIRRSHMTEAEVRAIISRQSSRAEYLQLADNVIQNGGDLENLVGQVAVLHESYMKMQNSH